MTEKLRDFLKEYQKLTDQEKYEFFQNIDEAGGVETYTVGMQIDAFLQSMEE